MTSISRKVSALAELQAHSAASSTSNGTEFNLGGGYNTFSLEVTHATTVCSVALQVSLSGGSSSWTTILTWAASSDSSGDIKGYSSGAYTRIRAPLTAVSSSGSANVYLAVSQ